MTDAYDREGTARMPQTYAITFEASAEVTPGEPENTDTEENDR